MAIETNIRPPTPPSVAPWPPDDTEESILGTNLHQTTITNLRFGVNEAAHLHQESDTPLPWEASSQILIMGWRRPDGSAYRIFPDVFVYPHPIDPNRSSMSLRVDGPPVFVIEVLSDAAYDVDLDTEAGKGYSYAEAGVREYLTLDPTGMFVADGGRGWRLIDGRYQPWERDRDGRWRSDEIGVAIGLDGGMATVYTADGRRLPREGEASRRLAEMEARMAREAAVRDELLAREAAARDELIARQAAEIEELRRRLRAMTGDE